MPETVDVGAQDVSLYKRSAIADAVSQLRQLAAPLEGAGILHVNATPYGGGVAEILRSEIPLLRDLGLVADWKLIAGDQTSSSVTKAIHNGLQGREHFKLNHRLYAIRDEYCSLPSEARGRPKC